MPEPAAQVPDPAARVWTVPNGLSMARLAGVPVFLWLVLGPRADGWAVGLLIAAAATDWLDGKIARAWNQESRLGQVLDPAADRLYIAATIIALAVRGHHSLVAGRPAGRPGAGARAWPCWCCGPAATSRSR